MTRLLYCQISILLSSSCPNKGIKVRRWQHRQSNQQILVQEQCAKQVAAEIQSLLSNITDLEIWFILQRPRQKVLQFPVFPELNSFLEGKQQAQLGIGSLLEDKSALLDHILYIGL